MVLKYRAISGTGTVASAILAQAPYRIQLMRTSALLRLLVGRNLPWIRVRA
jgi:hypothetical protein